MALRTGDEENGVNPMARLLIAMFLAWVILDGVGRTLAGWNNSHDHTNHKRDAYEVQKRP